jgi:hypothetical protein
MKETPHSKKPCYHEGLNLSYDKKIHMIQNTGQYSQILIYGVRYLLKATESNKYWKFKPRKCS